MVYMHYSAGKEHPKLRYKSMAIMIQISYWLEHNSPFVALDMKFRTCGIWLVALIIMGRAEM